MVIFRNDNLYFCEICIIIFWIQTDTVNVCLITVSQYHKTLTSEGNIASPHFPFYYGADIDCFWTITAPRRLFVKLTFSLIKLLPRFREVEVI